MGNFMVNIEYRPIYSIGFDAHDLETIKDALYFIEKLEYGVREFTRNARSMLIDLETELHRREG